MTRAFGIVLVLALAAPGCRKDTSQPQAPSPRIVSFSPALTDLLYDMELGEHVVGVTSYCMPQGGSTPPVVGNRNRVSAESILAVKPDVILIQQNPSDFGAVRSIDPKVRIESFRFESLDDIASAIERIGSLTGKETLAARHKKRFLDGLEAVRRRVAGRPRSKVLFVVGYDRPSTGGKGTFMDEMIRLAGGTNAAADRGYVGWKNLNRENILAMAPQILICQVAPGRRDEARKYWRSLTGLPAARNGRIFCVTDRRWTIPSMRSAVLAEQLAEMIHPDIGPEETRRD